MPITGIQYSNAPYLIIQAGSSINGLVSFDATKYVFGLVKGVYFNCNRFFEGDSVYFDKTKGTGFRQSTDNYYLVDQQYIFFTEKVLS